MANTYLPDWQEWDKNDLIREAAYCENKLKKEGLIAAIVVKYWNKIESMYYKTKLVTTPEECHSWLIKGIMYALDKKPWEREDASIYNDPKGPDKVVNRHVESCRLTFYQQLNRYNRKINAAILSLDSLQDDYKDIFIPKIHIDGFIEFKDIILKYFNQKDYFTAFMLDIIIHENVFTPKLNIKRLSHYLRYMDEKYLKFFSDTYNLSYEEVINAASHVLNLNLYKTKKKIEYNLIRLKEVLNHVD